jgi:hypothetical protein
MIAVTSINGVPVRLTRERWDHIINNHPEMADQKEKVLETASNPDLIQQADLQTLIAAKYYLKTPLSDKFLSVVYKETGTNDGFILTAYFANKLSERRSVIWKR